MKINRLNGSIALGLIAIIGILVAQLLWTKEAYSLEEKKFSQKAHIALLEVAKRLYEGTSNVLPSENPVRKISNDYYIVDVNNVFDAEILEFYLKQEFAKVNLNADFEYAMYNCQSDEMVYGNYVSKMDKNAGGNAVYFPKHKNLVYYFAIRFPNETSILFSSLRFWFVLSGALFVILLVYAYSIFTILQQRKYSELQKDFINNMTHEFKTPLSSILIAANYLSNHQAIKTDEKLTVYSKIIGEQSKKLNSHIEKILTVAKSDSNQMILQKETVLLPSLIAEVVENVKLRNPQLCVEVIPDLQNVAISMDVFHFTNLLYNLFDNSMKYCDAQPKITIEILNSKSDISLNFIDNGVGVGEKKLPFIFDKFYREPTPKSMQVTGFGLGLYYVKKIVELHKWHISAANNRDKGLTINILMQNK